MSSHNKFALLTLLLGLFLWLTPLSIRAQNDPYPSETPTATFTLAPVGTCEDDAYKFSHCSCDNSCQGVPENSEF